VVSNAESRDRISQPTINFRRRVVNTRYPLLYLERTDEIIYIKPIPAYFTSYAFWKQHLIDLIAPSILHSDIP